MKLHFVCTGNTFRSRLAEAYLNSKNLPNLEVSSSGIGAMADKNGPITWYAQRIIEQEGLVAGEKMMWTQTTREILDSQDLIIFMNSDHLEEAKKLFKFNNQNYEVWDINDVTGDDPKTNIDSAIPETEQIYNKIKIRIEDLITRNFKPQLPKENV